MKCAVIIPVGPEHEALALDASVSVSKAAAASRGPFDDVAVVRVDDNRGEIGRSVGGGRVLYRLASTRSGDEIARLAKDAFGRPINL